MPRKVPPLSEPSQDGTQLLLRPNYLKIETGEDLHVSSRCQHSSHSMVERANKGSVACLGRRVARVDPRCVRLHDLPAVNGANLQGLRGATDRSRHRLHTDVVDAAGRRHRVGLARRSGWPQEAADDLDRLVFAVQPLRGSRAELLVAVAVPHRIGHRHGRGMARRRGAGYGNMAATLAWLHGLGAAGLLGPWSAAFQRRLWAAV